MNLRALQTWIGWGTKAPSGPKETRSPEEVSSGMPFREWAVYEAYYKGIRYGYDACRHGLPEPTREQVYAMGREGRTDPHA